MMKKVLSALLILLLISGCSQTKKDDTVVHVGSLKGPTSIGLLSFMNEDNPQYQFDMVTQADELMAGLVSGDYDIILIPANASSILYNKTNKGIKVIDINTLGVLYCITGDESITSIKDLSGKTVITTGQGTTPEYALRYLLNKYEVNDCTLEFKSEATEVAAVLASDPNAIGVLPQPFVSATQANNDKVKISFSLTEEWDQITSDSRLITGVTVVRNEFLEEHESLVKEFLEKHNESVEKVSSDLDTVAKLAVEKEIIGAEPLAKIAIPQCNIVCITGNDMKNALSGYLQSLYDFDPQSVGGNLPDDSFYY